MKRLHVTQVYNRDYFGDSTPDVDKHVYKVTKVIDSTGPTINTELTKQEVQNYCESESWQVTVS